MSGQNPDGPATPKQIAIVRALAAAGEIELSISSPTRRDVAGDIQALRCVAGNITHISEEILSRIVENRSGC